MRLAKTLFTALAAAGILAAQSQPPLAQRIAARLRPNGLKADISFLASDALQGRATPSPGLDMAAEYIAAQFRRAGLEPVGDDGYFQNAGYQTVKPNPEGLAFTLDTAKAGEGTVAIQEAVATDLNRAAAFKVTLSDTAALDALTAEEVRGKVLLVEVPDGGGAGMAAFQAQRRILTLAAKLEPAIVVMVRAAAQQTNPNARVPLRDATAPAPKVPILNVWDKAIRDAVAAAKPGPIEAAVSAHLAAPIVQPVKLRNVAGVLRGTDPQLKDTYVVVTGHYDHLGVRPNAQGDSIYNGANDDASGAASVIAIANALAELEEKPKRTIVFVTVFGEELGGLGARWYTGHPIFPIARTVADINLEQLGRTDDNEGPKVAQFNLTGFDYTDIAATFAKAGAVTGVQVIKHEKNSDSFFGRSDNATFADAGIPSTTLSVSYIFPDYHQPGDEWQKLDYDNLAKVDVTVALGILDMANSAQAPQWNKENPKTARYVQAREKQ
ncbi:MAG: M20/M25/M40 family metallo-hydrolase [Candidatus Solibacter sp.]|nr:M20/M25/M40 family metallo-hydrolase [Candidatus Solibacter sp.]